MPVIKYRAVHTTPKAHLKYILNSDKNEDLKYASGLNADTDYLRAFEDFRIVFEHFDEGKFDAAEQEGRKKRILIHSYIQSFDDTVSAETAHKIGVEWAKEVFGADRPIIVSTHTNTGHVHNHIAVCPYDLHGNRWHANKKTLAKARNISDKIAKRYNVAVIDSPSRSNTASYCEWLARNRHISWKIKMAEDIDIAILRRDVTDIDSLIMNLEEKGYTFTDREKLIAKPRRVKYGCRLDKLGYGYSRDMLEYRIANKGLEMLGRKYYSYGLWQLEIAVCLKHIQYELYRTPPKASAKNIGQELEKNLELLRFISENYINSKQSFEDTVNRLDREEKHMEEVVKYNSMGGSYRASDFDAVIRNRERNRAKLEKAQADKKHASEMYKRFLDLMESDFDRIMREEKAIRELELYKKGYEITPDGKPYIDRAERQRTEQLLNDFPQKSKGGASI